MIIKARKGESVSEIEKIHVKERDQYMRAVLTSKSKNVLCEYCVKETTIQTHFLMCMYSFILSFNVTLLYVTERTNIE